MRTQNLKLTLCVPETKQATPIPLFSSQVQAGFPSPAEDHIEARLDLNELMIEHPAATFFMRVEGESMKNAGIHSGDILVVDRSLTPKNGQIVISILNGEFTVKRIKIEKNHLYLIPENPNFHLMQVTEEMDFQVWGTVTYIIHKVK